MVDQCKQRRVLCHIGLVRDHGAHLVNQPVFQFLRSVGKQHLSEISTIRKTKHVEENVQMSGLNLIEGIWCG